MTATGAIRRTDLRTVDPTSIARGRQLLHDDDVYAEVAETFRALADFSRAKIVYSLLHQELCVCDLAAIVNLSESAVSQHLRVLRNLRLVKSRREGKCVYYSLDDAHIQVLLDVCLNHVQHLRDDADGLDPGLAVAPRDSAWCRIKMPSTEGARVDDTSPRAG